MKNTKTPEDIKKGLECCGTSAITCNVCPYEGECHLPFGSDPESDALALIQQHEEEKKCLQESICNQRRQLRVLHAMYEWALRRLQKAGLNDRANFQAFLRKKGYDLATMELPESKQLQLERERDAAIEDARGVCKACIHFNGHYPPGEIMSCCKFEECIHGADDYDSEDHWQWRGAQETDH